MSRHFSRRVGILLPIFALGLLVALVWFVARKPSIDEPPILASNALVPRVQDAQLESARIDRASNSRELVAAEPTSIETPPPVEATAVRTPTPVEATAIRPIVLTGNVTDSRGNSIVTAEENRDRVLIVTAAGEYKSAPIRAGRYAFEGLEPGDFVLKCGVWGYRGPVRHFTLRPNEPTHFEDIVLEPYWMLAVHVLTPDGLDLRHPLQDQRIKSPDSLAVLATLEPLGEQLKPTYNLDRSGEGVGHTLPVAQAGSASDDRMEIDADPPVYVSVVLRDQVLAARRVEERLSEVTFTIEVAQVRLLLSGLVFRLEDGETGMPATDANVCLVTAQSTEASIRPDADGWIRYSDRLPGLYKAHIFSKGRASLLREVELAPGRVTDLGTIRLGKGLEISGQFVDVDAHPVQLAACFVPLGESDDVTARSAWMLWAVKVDAEGRFSMKGLSAGRYILKACSMSSFKNEGAREDLDWVPVLVDTRSGPVESLLIVAQRKVEVVLRPGSADLRKTSYRVLAANGMECAEGEFVSFKSERLHFVPGAYTLRLMKKRETLREIPFTVGADPMTIDVGP